MFKCSHRCQCFSTSYVPTDMASREWTVSCSEIMRFLDENHDFVYDDSDIYMTVKYDKCEQN